MAFAPVCLSGSPLAIALYLEARLCVLGHGEALQPHLVVQAQGLFDGKAREFVVGLLLGQIFDGVEGVGLHVQA